MQASAVCAALAAASVHAGRGFATHLAACALVCACLASPLGFDVVAAARADVALAIGVTPRGVSRDGAAVGYAVGPDSEKLAGEQAVAACRAFSPSPAAAKSCRVREHRTEGCVAVVMDKRNGTPGFGWGIDDDVDAAVEAAAGACRKTAGRRQRHCETAAIACDFAEARRTIAAYGRAIALVPDNGEYFRRRGIARIIAGEFADASDDLRRAGELETRNYTEIMRYIAQRRSGDEAADAALKTRVAKLKDKAWPFAGLEFFAGQRSAADMMAAATEPGQLCEANYYAGVKHLMEGDPTRAAFALEVATANCPKWFDEYRAAKGELQRIGR